MLGQWVTNNLFLVSISGGFFGAVTGMLQCQIKICRHALRYFAQAQNGYGNGKDHSKCVTHTRFNRHSENFFLL